MGLRDGRDVGGGQFGKGLECQMEEFGFILQNKRSDMHRSSGACKCQEAGAA